MASVSSTGIAMSGVFSGINSDTLVQAGVAKAGAPLARLVQHQKSVTAQQAALTDIATRLKDLQGITATLSDTANLQAASASSSDKTVLNASATGAAAEGAYQIEVNQLAKAHRLVSTAGAAAMDSLVGTGQFVYSYGGVTRTRATTATTTLEGLRDLINNDASNPGVTASILNVNGTYHLVLAGRDTGAGNDIAINDGLTTLAGFDTADFTQTQASQNAQLRVDGFPAATWIERETNTINDVLPGVTLSLYKNGTSTVSVARDTSGLAKDMDNLVAIYNGLMAKVSAYTSYNAETKTAGVLQGDITVRAISEGIRNRLSGGLSGFEAGTDTYSMAADIGLSFDRDGVLSLDSEKFDTALADDFQGILQFLGASGSGRSSNSSIQFTQAAASTDPGKYDVEVSFGPGGGITSARIRPDGGDWRSMDINGTAVSGQLGKAEAGLILTGIWPGGGETTQATTVYVQQGMGGQINDLVDAFLKPITGAVDTAKTRFTTQLDDISKKIRTQNDYLDKVEARLKAKYARMETMLSQLDSTRASFQALFDSVDQSKKQNG